MDVRFLLVCEGSSDAALINHIERLLIDCGASQADGTAFHMGSGVADKIRDGLTHYGDADLLFVHRDADSAGSDARFSEIAREIDAAGYSGRWIGIVPIRAMEAWLLVDETAIRRVVGRPTATESLDLPAIQDLERVADPKEKLKQVLSKAALPQGNRRRKKFAADFGRLRRQLAENLAIGGPLERVSAWVRLRGDVTAAIETWHA